MLIVLHAWRTLIQSAVRTNLKGSVDRQPKGAPTKKPVPGAEQTRYSFRPNSSVSLAMFTAIRRALSCKVLEINMEHWGFQRRRIGGSHEAFAVHPGSFRSYRLHRKIR